MYRKTLTKNPDILSAKPLLVPQKQMGFTTHIPIGPIRVILLMAENPAPVDMVVYPIIYRVWYIPGGARFQPLTVGFDKLNQATCKARQNSMGSKSPELSTSYFWNAAFERRKRDSICWTHDNDDNEMAPPFFLKGWTTSKKSLKILAQIIWNSLSSQKSPGLWKKKSKNISRSFKKTY